MRPSAPTRIDCCDSTRPVEGSASKRPAWMIVVTCAAGAGAGAPGACAKLDEASRTAAPTAPANAIRCSMVQVPKRPQAREIHLVAGRVNLILALGCNDEEPVEGKIGAPVAFRRVGAS